MQYESLKSRIKELATEIGSLTTQLKGCIATGDVKRIDEMLQERGTKIKDLQRLLQGKGHMLLESDQKFASWYRDTLQQIVCLDSQYYVQLEHLLSVNQEEHTATKRRLEALKKMERLASTKKGNSFSISG